MTLADKLNHLNVDAAATKGVVELVPNPPDGADVFDSEGCLKPEHAWLDDAVSYLDKGHSDEPFTYYVEHGGEAARWDEHECEWVETRV